MAKIKKSYRIEEEVLKKLDYLVDYYSRKTNITLTNTAILEKLILDEYGRKKEENRNE